MNNRKLALVLILGFLTSCASRTQIHVFSLGMEANEISQLASLLEEDGFDVRPNSLLVPPNIVRHTIVFPAIVQDFATVELIESIMAKAGYPRTRLILEEESNHYYSTNNIGIYLVNPDFDKSYASLVDDPYSLGGDEATPLTYNYFSECPKGSEAQSELNLYPSGVALLEEFIWDEEKNQEMNQIHEGEWSTDSRSVRINFFDKGELNLSIEDHSGTNHFGPFKGLTLAVQNSTLDIERCNYTYLDYED